MEETAADRFLSIKGLTCPFTFVKAKLAIESLAVGQVLDILMDSEEAFRSVPKAMEDLGHRVELAEKVNDTDWRLLIRKEKD
ncbi:MAG: sulfurtransferase TusA family protein [Thermodesulfovibrionales bacterium]